MLIPLIIVRNVNVLLPIIKDIIVHIIDFFLLCIDFEIVNVIEFIVSEKNCPIIF